MIIKEACVEGFSQGLRAQELGADRIELCENLAEGGTTPSIGTIIMCKRLLRIPIVVMIRPRGGNFIYSNHEIGIMEHDIKASRDAGADGIAIGILDKNNHADIGTLLKLLKHAGDMKITFHKAIDITSDIEHEFIRLRDSGLVHRVLTSGGQPDALTGAPVLRKLMELSSGKMDIVVAGKVTNENLSYLAKLIPAREFHGKKIVGEPGTY
jgi:copper homeostasis protein